mgnify:CR=1 FL=1
MFHKIVAAMMLFFLAVPLSQSNINTTEEDLTACRSAMALYAKELEKESPQKNFDHLTEGCDFMAEYAGFHRCTIKLMNAGEKYNNSKVTCRHFADKFSPRHEQLN